MSYQDFSSWPPAEEGQFIVFEQRTIEASKKAQVVGYGFAAGLALLVLIIVIGFWGPIKIAGVEEGAAGEKPPAEATEAGH